MPRLGVLGWPVAHSRSPAMHAAALRELGLAAEWSYQHLPVPPDLLGETVRALPAVGFRGVNVTIPHKEAALALADTASPAARAIGAANTLTFTDGAIHADNTDAPGLLAVLPADPRGSTAVVLGAGGSARAAVWALRDAGAREVLVWNRTAARARAVAAELGATAVEALPGTFDIVVNCTSVGLHDGASLKDLPLDADALAQNVTVVDLVYRSPPAPDTPLVRAARAQGARAVGGLEVLVRQGALSLERWTGLPAPVEAMRQAVLDPHHEPSSTRQRQ